jgi:GxxExxY protein
MLYVKSELVRRILGAAITVHRALGPGLFESSYETCFTHELTDCGLSFVRQVPVPVVYKGVRLDCGYRADVLIENTILIELKCVERWLPIHRAQMMTYLRHLGLRQGLLVNFNVTRLVDGLRNVLVEPPRALGSDELEKEILRFESS